MTGLRVGALEGSAVGLFVGSAGLDVGALEGLEVGLTGLAVGSEEGLEVGLFEEGIATVLVEPVAVAEVVVEVTGL